MRMTKYQREEKARYDKQQTILTENTIKPNPRKYAETQLEDQYNKKVICPFCLTWTTIQKMLISTKSGYNKGLGCCPNCHNNIQFKTLFNMLEWEPPQFAKWIYDYRLTGFWQKIKPSFQEWNKQLYNLGFGFGKEFWDTYKRLKGEPNDNESIYEHYERKAQEEQSSFEQ